ncbi:Uncharacterised protein [Chromobacterium violaceum]|uniref:Uncharacterized protein n=1 Tax=Chromobacterium violaceum TaxID=536 RepID=A0A447T4P6_CHRVL|nr:Uncharacterised protein [Chromobacterium violaceum]
MDNVSSARPSAFSCRCKPRRRANCAASLAVSSVGSGMHIRPRSLKRGSAATARASAAASSGAQPLLLSSPDTLTCTQTFSAGRPSGRCADRRSAIFSRSIECTQCARSATMRVLFDCRGPMKCHSISSPASASHFCCNSCT